MRLTIALILTAAALAAWATESIKSFLLAFLITFFWTALACGIGLVIAELGKHKTPTHSEKELDEIEFDEYLAALDRATEGDS